MINKRVAEKGGRAEMFSKAAYTLNSLFFSPTILGGVDSCYGPKEKKFEEAATPSTEDLL